jgi:cytochrome c
MFSKAFTSMCGSAAIAAIALCFSISASAEINAVAAKELARANECLKCHGVDKAKDGPAYNKVAEKYRGRADAEEKLIIHLTTGKLAKFPDGHEEEHKIIKTKDTAELKNLIAWILSL